MKQISNIQQLQGQPMLVADVSPLKGWLWSYCKFSLLPKPWQPSDDQVLMDVLDKSCSYCWSWSSLITLSLDRSSSDAEPKLYLWFFLKVCRWTWNWGFLGWSSLFIPCHSRLDQGWTVVQGFGQGCSWAEDKSSEAEANFTMLSLLSPWQQTHFTMVLWLESNLCQGFSQGKCFLSRDVVENRMSHLWISPCFWDWSISFLSLFLLLCWRE